MSDTGIIIAVITSIGLLVLNWAAFRQDAAIAGHDKKQMLKMAAIWITIFAVVVGVFALLPR